MSRPDATGSYPARPRTTTGYLLLAAQMVAFCAGAEVVLWVLTHTRLGLDNHDASIFIAVTGVIFTVAIVFSIWNWRRRLPSNVVEVGPDGVRLPSPIAGTGSGLIPWERFVSVRLNRFGVTEWEFLPEGSRTNRAVPVKNERVAIGPRRDTEAMLAHVESYRSRVFR